MSNMNTSGGWSNLPAVVAATTSAFTYKVPAAGVYPSLPSVNQIAGNALVLSVQPGDLSSGSAVDFAQPFKVQLSGQINSQQSENITVALYQVSNSVALAGFTAATGTGQVAIATTGTMASGGALKFNFMLEAVCIWDSVSTTLTSQYNGVCSAGTPRIVTSAIQTAAVTTAAEKDLNFYFVLTAATNTTADTLGPFNFTWSRY